MHVLPFKRVAVQTLYTPLSSQPRRLDKQLGQWCQRKVSWIAGSWPKPCSAATGTLRPTRAGSAACAACRSQPESVRLSHFRRVRRSAGTSQHSHRHCWHLPSWELLCSHSRSRSRCRAPSEVQVGWGRRQGDCNPLVPPLNHPLAQHTPFPPPKRKQTRTTTQAKQQPRMDSNNTHHVHTLGHGATTRARVQVPVWAAHPWRTWGALHKRSRGEAPRPRTGPRKVRNDAE